MKSLSVILGLVLLVGCSQREPKVAATKSPSIEVRTVEVSTEVIPHTQTISGIVHPVDRATISANIRGTITVARLAVGQLVSVGEILVEMEARELNARLERARAALALAAGDYTRERALAAQGAATRESVRTSLDRRRIAQAAFQEAGAMLGYIKIAAPFSGVITSDFVNPGDLATPGQPLFELEGTSHLRAEVLVPESLSAPELGSTIAIVLNGKTTTGHLAELSPATDPNSRTRLAKIDLPTATEARSGQFIRAHWPIDKLETLTMPANALSLFGQMERVFVVTDGAAHLRIIKTGATHDNRVEILSGLESGERVIIAPPSTIRDGQPVEIIK